LPGIFRRAKPGDEFPAVDLRLIEDVAGRELSQIKLGWDGIDCQGDIFGDGIAIAVDEGDIQVSVTLWKRL